MTGKIDTEVRFCRFMKIAEGVFPHSLINEAKLHSITIANNETVKMRQLQLNSGVAASTLSLLSQKKVKKKNNNW